MFDRDVEHFSLKKSALVLKYPHFKEITGGISCWNSEILPNFELSNVKTELKIGLIRKYVVKHVFESN